ncbi:HalOD1 output domain-containing protein [Haloplanus pelagicus]|uniref:HalOD1 output domain-containing protein n=1 Tax=Haloplanus pelagicus TaxID=2949995 RepID=UPI0020409DC1|nr:HalOD1 output domain-containing protein [Haloplanus sp. HW8-1]
MSAHPTILHVDDDPTTLDLSSDRADDEGLTWLTASDSEAGLAILAERDVDCLVSDSFRTPDGEPFVTRATDVDPDLPVVLFTAADRDAVDAEARRTAARYVKKGTADEFGTLLDHVSTLLDGPPDGWRSIGRHDWEKAGTSLATTIVTAVEADTGRDASTISPLYESIDAETLASLLRRPDGEARDGIRVRFGFAGEELAVTSAGAVLVRTERE